MRTFEYKGFDAHGRSCRGLVEALDLKEAREKITALGFLPEKVTAAGESGLHRPQAARRLKMDVRALVYREISSLLHAGIPLAQALDILIQAPELAAQSVLLAGVRDRIREGTSFGAALSETGRNVSPFERAVVDVGERAGNLDEVLERLAGYLEEQIRLKDRIQTALIYPAIVFILALLIVMIMLGVMVPTLGRMLVESHVPLPLLTRVMMFSGQWIIPVLLPTLVALTLAGLMLHKRMGSDADLRRRFSRLLFELPLIRRAWGTLVNLRFARTLALLIRGGVPLVEGMAMAGRATGSEWVLHLAEEQSQAVRHGRSLSDAVRRIGPLSASLPGWITAGEAGGQLATLLDSAGDRYQQQWDRWITRFLNILEPVLILAVGGFVLMISLSILLPILQLNKTLM